MERKVNRSVETCLSCIEELRSAGELPRNLDNSGGDDVGLRWSCHGMAEPLMMSQKCGGGDY